MANTWFSFKQFTVHQDQCAMKVCTDACLFGAWAAENSTGKENRILDIGTGTGLLSLMLAQKLSSPIDAVEIDEAAAHQARTNADLSPWKDRIQIHNADISHFIPEATYDLIISNPPFFENDLRSNDERVNRARHDTSLTLNELLTYISSNLSSVGRAMLLLPYSRETEIIAKTNQMGLSINRLISVRNHPRMSPFRFMVTVQKVKESPIQKSEIIIKDENGVYTTAFSNLLRDYYLHL